MLGEVLGWVSFGLSPVPRSDPEGDAEATIKFAQIRHDVGFSKSESLKGPLNTGEIAEQKLFVPKKVLLETFTGLDYPVTL